MRKRNNPIPKEHQHPRQVHMGFADEEFEEQKALPRVEEDWDRNCDGETYENLDLRHLDFRNGSYVGTSFINCDLRNRWFNGSNLSRTNFKDSDLGMCSFNHLQAFENINFENCDLRDAWLLSRDGYSSCNWNNANIDHARIESKEFFLLFLEHRKNPDSSVYIHGSPEFRYIFLDGANLEGANLQGLHFIGLQVNSANLQGANLQDTNLKACDFRNTDLRGANLQGTYFFYSDLTSANVRGATYNRNTSGFLTDKQKSEMVFVKD